MHHRFDRLARLLCAALASVLLVSAAGFASGEDEPALHNWGRWGADDERGAANYLTPERIVAAARLIETGKTFSLAIPLDEKGPVYPGRLNPPLDEKGPVYPGRLNPHLEGALAKQGTEVKPGDIVLVRTGYVGGYYQIEDSAARFQYLRGPQAGIGREVVPWIHEKQIAAMAADNLGLEAVPIPADSVHGAMLKDLGVYMGEIWWLDDLAADCAADGRYAFFLAAQPLHIPGAVGSPLNPVAIK
jgi:hypothetical protein